MSERHIHAEVIIAWANGEEIEVRQCYANGLDGPWELFDNTRSPYFNSWQYEYRIKPKQVSKEQSQEVNLNENQIMQIASLAGAIEALKVVETYIQKLKKEIEVDLKKARGEE